MTFQIFKDEQYYIWHDRIISCIIGLLFSVSWFKIKGNCCSNHASVEARELEIFRSVLKIALPSTRSLPSGPFSAIAVVGKFNADMATLWNAEGHGSIGERKKTGQYAVSGGWSEYYFYRRWRNQMCYWRGNLCKGEWIEMKILNEMWVHSPPLGAQGNFNKKEKHDTM